MGATSVMKRKLVSQNDSSLIKKPDVPRSQFINRFGLKTAFNAGVLVPIMVQEILPGDHIKWTMNAAIRLDTPYFPVMDSQRIDVHVFYDPTRLLWPNFQKMLGQQDNPDDDIDFTVPILSGMPANGPAIGTLADYMGIPTAGQITAGQGTNMEINALPFRMIPHVWNEWFRAQSLQDSMPFSNSDADSPYADYATNLLPRNKSFDYSRFCHMRVRG